MPHYKAMHFGWKSKQAIEEVQDQLFIKHNMDLIDEEEQEDELIVQDQVKYDAMTEDFMEIQKQSIEELGKTFPGFKYLGKNNNYPIYDTPFGRRECSNVYLNLCYDEHECGDTPERAVLGIKISARYFPSLLDLDDQHGGVEEDDDWTWTENAKEWQKKLADIFMNKVRAKYPVFETATLLTKTVFA